mmetsp:Transcript_15380/g.23032  ORF Transcript_15380/g.23032 Transcript_15380/m.23032 type:complete len:628 (-) Transcript_15380:266-2149(-)
MLQNSVFIFFFFLLIPLFTAAIPPHSLPNVGYVGYGIDMKIGTPVMDSLRGPVLRQSWDTNNTHYFNGQYYVVPDNFYFVATPSSTQQTVEQAYSSYQSVATGLYQTQTQGFSVDVFHQQLGMYHGSGQGQYFAQQSQAGRFTGFSYLQVEEWKVGLSPFVSLNYTLLDTKFLSWAKKLPFEFTADTCQSFKLFIELFGTHFIPETLWGGEVQMTSSFSENLYDQKGASAVKKELGRQFFLMTQKSLTSAEQDELSTLDAQYSSRTYLVGGDPSKYKPTDWPDWAFSVPYDPIPIAMAIVPISAAIPSKSYALNLAIRSYLRNGVVDSYSPMPTALYGSASAVLGDKVYFVDGVNGDLRYPNIFQVYSSERNQWNYASPPPTNLLNRMGTSEGGIVYFIGGSDLDLSQCLGTFDAYHPKTDSWEALSSIPTPRCSPSVVSSDGIVYAIGGSIDPLHGAYTNTVEAYDTRTKEWKLLPPIPTGRIGGTTSVAINGLIYVVGGQNSTLPSKYVEVYDPRTKSWSDTFAPPPYQVQAPSVQAVDGYIYVMPVLGWQWNTTPVQRYDPRSNNWEVLSTLSLPTTSHVKDFTTSVVEGIIYYFGTLCCTADSYESIVLTYTPSWNSWEETWC